MDGDYGFKFEIGSVVAVFGSDTKTGDDGDWASAGDQRFLVVEQGLQRCPGGVQRHYVCRGVAANGSASREYVRYNEVELVPSEPFKRLTPEQAIEALKERAAARTAAKQAAQENSPK